MFECVDEERMAYGISTGITSITARKCCKPVGQMTATHEDQIGHRLKIVHMMSRKPTSSRRAK
jgi:hypothetical protein